MALTISRNTIIALDITDPTPYEVWEEEEEDEVFEAFDGRCCPICGKPMMSDEYVVCASLADDTENKFTQIFHDDCLTDEQAELLEKIGYTLIEDRAEWFSK